MSFIVSLLTLLTLNPLTRVEGGCFGLSGSAFGLNFYTFTALSSKLAYASGFHFVVFPIRLNTGRETSSPGLLGTDINIFKKVYLK